MEEYNSKDSDYQKFGILTILICMVVYTIPFIGCLHYNSLYVNMIYGLVYTVIIGYYYFNIGYFTLHNHKLTIRSHVFGKYYKCYDLLSLEHVNISKRSNAVLHVIEIRYNGEVDVIKSALHNFEVKRLIKHLKTLNITVEEQIYH